MRLLRLLAAAGLLLGACGVQAARQPRLVGLAELESRVRGPRERALLLVFWATWCEPCVAEIPALVALEARSAGALEIVAVSLDAFLHAPDASLALVRQQLAKTPAPYEQLVYIGGQDPLFAAFDLPGGIPYAILFDRDGRPLQRFQGPVAATAVQAALAASAGSAQGEH